MQRQNALIAAATLLVLILLISAMRPYDYPTWILEVTPVLIALPIMAATYKRFPLTTLLYVLIFIHAVILIAGGTYTYARVPPGSWMQDMLALARNPYLFRGARDPVARRLPDQPPDDRLPVDMRRDDGQFQL